MHLLTLLSAIVALSLTPLVVGLPHPQDREQQEQQSGSNGLEKVAGYLGAVGLGVAGTTFFNHRTISRKLDNLKSGQDNLKSGQDGLRNGQNDIRSGQSQNAGRLEELRQDQAATQRQLGDHVGETRAGFERVNGQLSRIGTQNPASAGQENTPPGESRIYDLKEDMTHTRILGKTRDLELCILDNIPDKDIYTTYEFMGRGGSAVSAKTWNEAVNKCSSVKGWVPELLANEQNFEGWWIGVRVLYDPSRQRIGEGPRTPMQFSVNDPKGGLISQLRSGIAHAFKLKQGTPLSGMGGRYGIGRGAPLLGGARLGM